MSVRALREYRESLRLRLADGRGFKIPIGGCSLRHWLPSMRRLPAPARNLIDNLPNFRCRHEMRGHRVLNHFEARRVARPKGPAPELITGRSRGHGPRSWALIQIIRRTSDGWLLLASRRLAHSHCPRHWDPKKGGSKKGLFCNPTSWLYGSPQPAILSLARMARRCDGRPHLRDVCMRECRSMVQ